LVVPILDGVKIVLGQPFVGWAFQPSGEIKLVLEPPCGVLDVGERCFVFTIAVIVLVEDR
jgi:hypothetical protein